VNESASLNRRTLGWQDNLLVLGAMIGSFAPWEEVCLGAEQHDTLASMGRRTDTQSSQPAILTALLNFQQQ